MITSSGKFVHKNSSFWKKRIEKDIEIIQKNIDNFIENFMSDKVLKSFSDYYLEDDDEREL